MWGERDTPRESVSFWYLHRGRQYWFYGLANAVGRRDKSILEILLHWLLREAYREMFARKEYFLARNIGFFYFFFQVLYFFYFIFPRWEEMNLLPAKCDRTTNRWSAREIGEVFNEPMFVPFLLLYSYEIFICSRFCVEMQRVRKETVKSTMKEKFKTPNWNLCDII